MCPDTPNPRPHTSAATEPNKKEKKIGVLLKANLTIFCADTAKYKRNHPPVQNKTPSAKHRPIDVAGGVLQVPAALAPQVLGGAALAGVTLSAWQHRGVCPVVVVGLAQVSKD